MKIKGFEQRPLIAEYEDSSIPLITSEKGSKVIRLEDGAARKAKWNIAKHLLVFFGVFVVAYMFTRLYIRHYGLVDEQSGLSFANYYGDSMVLQKKPARAIIWGYVESTLPYGYLLPTVFLEFRGKKYPAHIFIRTDGKQVWSVSLDPTTSGGPYQLTATVQHSLYFMAYESSIKLINVMFGDVWVCSGQSNMQFRVKQIFNSTQEFKESINYPDIRLFAISRKPNDNPQYDVPGIDQPWASASPVSLGLHNSNTYSAVCYLFAKYMYQHRREPLGMIEADWGGTSIRVWTSDDVNKKCGEPSHTTNNMNSFMEDGLLGTIPIPSKGSSLWNSMIHPLVNMTIYGALFYQGENDAVENPNHYNCTFPGMIRSWRQHFHYSSQGQTNSNFPFGFVQIGPRTLNMSVAGGYPLVRWHQTVDKGFAPNPLLPNVFMSTAMDLEDPTSPYSPVHIRDKQDVAYRLFANGLSVAYNDCSIDSIFPYPSAFTMVNKEDINYIHISFGLPPSTPACNYTRPKIHLQQSHGFEVNCHNQSNWNPVTILSADDYAVNISLPNCSTTGDWQAIRYLWRETPCHFKRCPLYSTKNLPVLPFVYPHSFYSNH